MLFRDIWGYDFPAVAKVRAEEARERHCEGRLVAPCRRAQFR